ncbi:MAG: GTP-binding protein [Pseudomonadota bacterium]
MIWKRVRNVLPSWFSLRSESSQTTDQSAQDRELLTDMTTHDDKPGQSHLALARESLRELLNDKRVPADVRSALADDYAEIQRLLDKLEHGHVHIAVFGRVSVGKSSLLNALLGHEAFSTSPIHGETRTSAHSSWDEYDTGGVFLIDTPGINEVDGEAREQLARDVAGRVDLILFVIEGDLTDTEYTALKLLVDQQRPLIVVVNKVDRYLAEQRKALLDVIHQRLDGLVASENIVEASADPATQVVITVDQQGNETESTRTPEPDVASVKARLWSILEAEGQTLSALNAGLFASDLTDSVAARIVELRKELGDKVIRTYCLSKGVAVAINPVPVADLFAAAFIDGAMVWHLSRLYDLPVTRAEAGTLVKVILTQAAALMGTVWAVHLVSAALKVGTGGMSVAVTAGAQGAVAYYSTMVVGKVAEAYLRQGKSWGEGGPKTVVRDILDSLDRDSILEQAKADIRRKLKTR